MGDGYINWGKKGFGDASCVGAGKTLTALSVAQRLVENNFNKEISNYKGILVLIPSLHLINTWDTEIKKHS